MVLKIIDDTPCTATLKCPSIYLYTSAENMLCFKSLVLLFGTCGSPQKSDLCRQLSDNGHITKKLCDHPDKRWELSSKSVQSNKHLGCEHSIRWTVFVEGSSFRGQEHVWASVLWPCTQGHFDKDGLISPITFPSQGGLVKPLVSRAVQIAFESGQHIQFRCSRFCPRS